MNTQIPSYHPVQVPPRRKPWPLRHKVLAFAVFPFALIVVIIVIAAAASSGSPGSSQLSGLPACTAHHPVSSGEWAQIAKDPGSWRGQCITVYGQVIQDDTNTGPGAFRGSAGGQHVAPSYGFADYPTSNVLYDGEAATLRPLVEGDLFTAQVTVAGDTTYTNVMGGSDSAPVLRVDAVTKTGHLDS